MGFLSYKVTKNTIFLCVKIVPCSYKIIKHMSISEGIQNHHAYHDPDLSTPRLDPRTPSYPYLGIWL